MGGEGKWRESGRMSGSERVFLICRVYSMIGSV
jgi:hypothetical protein